MSIQDLKRQMPDYAKDTKLNLSKVFSVDGAPGLTIDQIAGVGIASAYATKNAAVISAVVGEASAHVAEDVVHAAKAAAAIMGMNNVYYRFAHLVSDKDYLRMPANLRMNVIGNPGVGRVDFELMSLAVSAINGCGMCMDAHVNEVVKAGISKEGVQSAVRIAAVVASAAQVVEIESVGTDQPVRQAAE